METIATRIMEIVEDKGGNKSDFARKIGVTPAYISKLGKYPDRVPSDRTIRDICEKFGVSEVWLRTGQGKPYIQRDEDAEWQDVLAKITVSDDEVIRRIVKAYWFMDEQEKAVIRKLIDSFSAQK